MKKKVIKKRCEKVSLSKCEGVCRTYNTIQLKFAYMLEDMPEVKSFRCNILMEGLSEGDYTTDFLCQMTDGDYMVWECVFRQNLFRPSTAKLLEESRRYWTNRGIGWGLVVNEK